MRDYVNSAALQEYTTKLVAKLKTLFPGTPTAVATVAEMTDHNKTYVYVGTETGYTAGDWYYWDGSAWTSGGPFQATSIITDTTLAVAGEAADAKATGDAISAAKAAVLNAMAPAYSTSATYAVGDYVNYNGAIYRCTTAISTAEAWTAGHWAAVTLGADLEGQVSDLKTQIDDVNKALSEMCTLHGAGSAYVTNAEYMNLTPGGYYRIWVKKWSQTGIAAPNTLLRFGYTDDGTEVIKVIKNAGDTLSEYYDIYVSGYAVNPKFLMGGRAESGTDAVVVVEDISDKVAIDNHLDKGFEFSTGYEKIPVSPGLGITWVSASAMWTYSENGYTLSTPSDNLITLKKGDKISLTDYTGAVFSVFTKNGTNVYGHSESRTTDYIATEDCQCAVSIRLTPSALLTISDAKDLSGRVYAIHYNIGGLKYTNTREQAVYSRYGDV